jgi:D-alanyl-lipoteichoic acid acyltransferase DltB (MBOAT superfamily)
MTQRRNTLLMIALTVVLVVFGWLAFTHPNRALAKCDFVWFGVGGYWDCPKESGTNGIGK